MSNPTPTGFCLAEGEFFMLCPYNPSHQITNDRYARHVVQCRLTHRAKMFREGRRVDMGVCRYNYTHHVPGPELVSHQERCPDQHDLFLPMTWVNPEGVKKAAEEEEKAKVQVKVHGFGRGRRRVCGNQLPVPCQIVPGGLVAEGPGVGTEASFVNLGFTSTSDPHHGAAEAGKTAQPAASSAPAKSDWQAVHLLNMNQKNAFAKK